MITRLFITSIFTILYSCGAPKADSTSIPSSEEGKSVNWIKNASKPNAELNADFRVKLVGDSDFEFYLGEDELAVEYVLADSITHIFPDIQFVVTRNAWGEFKMEFLISETVVASSALGFAWKPGYSFCESQMPCQTELDKNQKSLKFLVTEFSNVIFANGLVLSFLDSEMKRTLLSGASIKRNDGTQTADPSTASQALYDNDLIFGRNTIVTTPKSNLVFVQEVIAKFSGENEVTFDFETDDTTRKEKSGKITIPWARDYPPFQL